MPGALIDNPALAERTGVFADRREAGVRLAELLAPLPLQNPLILAVPAGGVPVAVGLAERLRAPLEVAVVSKITLPWNSEAGYGAVAFDGQVELNQELLRRAGLSEREITAGIETTRAKVARRLRLFGQQPFSALSGRDLIVVDDGLASGYTLQVAVAALRRHGSDRLLLAVPTAHAPAARRLAEAVEAVYCPNLRSGPSYAVAAAYRDWQDVSETEVVRLLQQSRAPGQSPRRP